MMDSVGAMSASVTDPAVPASRRRIFFCAAAIALATFAAYHNTFRVPLLLDDLASIKDNPTILHLWPIWDVLNPPVGYGMTVSGRPVLNLSLALCHAVSGTNVWSYHALNLLIHIAAALTLFGVVRRTLCLRAGPAANAVERGGETPMQIHGTPASGISAPVSSGKNSASFQANATPIALAIALLWALHPLQTEAVTYTIQRTESLMGLFFLLTFYGFVRAVESPRPLGWQIFAVAACLLGMGTKEVMATAPALVFLFDRTFAAGTFREAWRRRRRLHLALAATWLPLVLLVAGTGWNRGGTTGFNVGISPWGYWFTQFEAVARYLKQSFWPHPLIFEYGKFQAGPADAAPYALIVVPLAVATLVALWRRPVPGFLGASFFAILAPTSLVPGAIQMIVEHRMYLPLAAVITLVVGAVASQLGRRTLPIFFTLAVAAGVLTEQRNRTYRSDLSLWDDTVAHRPESAIAQGGLGTALFLRGQLKEALLHYEISLRLNPSISRPHYNLGLTLLQLNRRPEAAAQFAEACRLDPRFYPAHFQLGQTLLLMSQPEEAAAQFEQVVRLMPAMAEAHYQWGVALARMGRTADAISRFREALQLNPDYGAAQLDLGNALADVGNLPGAMEHLGQAVKLVPNLADAHCNLGVVLAESGRAEEAVAEFQEALRLRPDYATAHYNLGNALIALQRLPEARHHFEETLRIDPHFNAARQMLDRIRAHPGVP